MTIFGEIPGASPDWLKFIKILSPLTLQNWRSGQLLKSQLCWKEYINAEYVFYMYYKYIHSRQTTLSELFANNILQFHQKSTLFMSAVVNNNQTNSHISVDFIQICQNWWIIMGDSFSYFFNQTLQFPMFLRLCFRFLFNLWMFNLGVFYNHLILISLFSSSDFVAFQKCGILVCTLW